MPKFKKIGKHARCGGFVDKGPNEYFTHRHRCTLNRWHRGSCDFSECPLKKDRSSLWL